MPLAYTTTTPEGELVAVVQTTNSDVFAASRRFRTFVSYRNGYEREASEIASRLNEFGITTFVASEDIKGGELWETEIGSAIQHCDALLAYATSDFGSGVWTNHEVTMAKRLGKPIYHIAPNGLSTGPVAEYQALKLDGGDVPILKYVERFCEWLRMAESIVWSIERCARGGSYSQANQLASAFRQLSVLGEDQARRLVDAYNSDECHPRFGIHNQVRESLGFARRTDRSNQSLITSKMNELTRFVTEHDEHGKILYVLSPPQTQPVATASTKSEVGDTFDPNAVLPRGEERVVMAR